MLQNCILKSLRDVYTRKKFLTLADVRAAEIGNELSAKALETLSPEDQQKTQEIGLKEFEVIKKHLPSLLCSGSHETAVAALENYLQSFPRASDAYFLLASVFEHGELFEKALEAIQTARYLKPSSRKILLKLQGLEVKALSKHRVTVELKVKSYTGAKHFALYSAAMSPDALNEIMDTEIKRRMAVDFMLLSRLGEDISLDLVNQYYTNSLNADDSEDPQNDNYQKAYRLEETFPFRSLATRQIDAGTVLMSDSPFAIAPLLDSDNPKLFPTCFHCLKEKPMLDRAFACPLFPETCPFVFCSKECVLRNVNVHRQECQFITSIVFPLAKETGFSAGFVLLVLRALIRSYIERSLRKAQSEELRFFFRLHSFTADYETQRPWVWNCIKALSRGLTLFLPLEFRLFMREEELQQFIAVIHSHALPVSYEVPAASLQRSAPTAALGLAMCHNVCSLGHSCIPSCSYVYTPRGRVVVRSLMDIPENGVLTISYIEDLFLPTSRRKNLDSSWKMLTCSCRRCREITEGGRHPRGQRCNTCVRGTRNPLAGKILHDILTAQQIEYPNKNPAFKTINEEMLKNLDSFNPPLNASTHKPGWFCTVCGVVPCLEATKSDALEAQVQSLLDNAQELCATGNQLKARSVLDDLVQQYGALLHPNHYILYNAHVHLAGLWNTGSGKNPEKALLFLRRALISSRAVLPIYHHEKQHLYSHLCDITYSVSMSQKSHSRGLGILGTSNPGTSACNSYDNALYSTQTEHYLSPIESIWTAVVNAWFTRGPQSFQWITALHRLRKVAMSLGIHTAPCLYVPKLSNTERVVATVRYLLRNSGLTTQDVIQLIQKDHQLIIFSACSVGDFTTLYSLTGSDTAAKRELETPNLMTGLTALGHAACMGQVEVVRGLLSQMDADMFAIDEWKMTPLLAMSSRPLDVLDTHITNNARHADAIQAEICVLFFQHAKKIENDRVNQMKLMKLELRKDIDVSKDFPFLRRRLLNAKSHIGIGENSAAHYAATRGKSILLSQLITCGIDINIRNAEYATPLHLACLSGHIHVVAELLRLGADVNAKNYRGETALMLACYGLYSDIIELLVIKGKANIEMTADISGTTCVHALVLGLTRTHKAQYLGSNKTKQDVLLTSLAGMNPITKDTLFDSTGGLGKTPPVTYLTMQVYEHETSNLFLFPEDMEHRVSQTEKILDFMDSHFPSKLLSLRMKLGYTAAELLKHRTDYFIEAQQDAWTQSDLKISALSDIHRMKTLERWRHVLSRMDQITEALQPHIETVQTIKSNAASDLVDKENDKPEDNLIITPKLSKQGVKPDINSTKNPPKIKEFHTSNKKPVIPSVKSTSTTPPTKSLSVKPIIPSQPKTVSKTTPIKKPPPKVLSKTSSSAPKQ